MEMLTHYLFVWAIPYCIASAGVHICEYLSFRKWGFWDHNPKASWVFLVTSSYLVWFIDEYGANINFNIIMTALIYFIAGVFIAFLAGMIANHWSVYKAAKNSNGELEFEIQPGAVLLAFLMSCYLVWFTAEYIWP